MAPQDYQPPPRQRPPGRPDPDRPASEKTVGEMVFEVSERTSNLIREEIELAKTEVSEKVTTLARGSAVGIAAGIFAFLALILLMNAFALGVSSLFGWGFWAGYLLEGVIFIAIAAGAGYFAYNSFEKTGAPIPTEAIEEAQKTKALLTPGDES
ncbi:MAG: phage holin family protein [Solirubrobacterales bacterium]|nr:phage holin family protein [Solirubrobacterales bacterium]MCB0861446.1 phage holin family protein [Solirubrobacterales bacterium]